MSAAADLYAQMLAALRDEGDLALCDALDMLARDTGQNRFRHASTTLRSAPVGPKPIDDTEALRRVMAFPAARRREAVGIVAKQIAGSADVQSVARRLRRKLRKNETDRPVMSV